MARTIGSACGVCGQSHALPNVLWKCTCCGRNICLKDLGTVSARPKAAPTHPVGSGRKCGPVKEIMEYAMAGM